MSTLKKINEGFYYQKNQQIKFNFGNVEDITKISLEGYVKVLLYRNPIERILSAYEDRFQLQCKRSCQGTQSLFGPIIINETRLNPSAEELAYGCPSFNEFLQYAMLPRNFTYEQYGKFEMAVRKQDKPCPWVTNSFNHW